MSRIEAAFELTPAQEGMLFHSLHRHDDDVFFRQFTCVLRGPVEPDRLRQAWEKVVARHPAMRTAFAWEGLPRPVQVVRASVRLPWAVHDCRRLGREEVCRRLDAQLAEDRRLGFDLTRAPLTRLTLFLLDGDVSRLVWSSHHLVLDGWSRALLLKEVLATYRALATGEDPELPPARPFQDFVAWLGQQDRTAAERFWRRELSGLGAATQLPTTGTAVRVDGRGFTHASRTTVLDRTASAGLRELARDSHVTLNTVVMAAWALLLRCYSGEDEVVFGSVVSGRPPSLPGVAEMAGMFINTLPVRLGDPGDRTLTQWLAEVQERFVAIRRFEAIPLAEVQRWSPAPPGRPLFESILAFENLPVDSSLRSADGDLQIVDYEVLNSTNYPFTLTVWPVEEIVLTAAFDTSRHAVVEVERWLAHLAGLLRRFTDAGDRPAGSLDVLTEVERQQVAVEWNDTLRRHEGPPTLPARLSVQARITPDATALVFDGQQLSYAGFTGDVNRLARHLGRLGVGPETRVGVFAERSLDLVTAIHAVVTAGGTYVPLDPGHPAERLRFMAEDAGLTLLLVGDSVADRLPDLNVPQLRLTADRHRWVGEPSRPPRVELLGHHAVYLIYTSGSTGRPKGVVNRHSALVNRLLWGQEALPLDVSDRVLHKTPVSFDVSVWELFWPLLVGATLVVSKPEGHRDPAHLGEAIDRERVTTAHFVPSMLAAFLDPTRIEGSCGSLRRVVASGEALPPETVQRHYARMPRAELHNLYGPTESAIEVSWHHCVPGEDHVPIGGPIANLRLDVVDRSLRRVPPGVTGELTLAGAGLARGYHGRPALTAERFVPDALGRGAVPWEPGGRVYRTGDLARWLPDGQVAFLGRLDHQVKVRGIRVELGEVETALASHPGVREAAVAVDRNPDGEARLVAYWVSLGKELHQDEVRRHLECRLPSPMVPSLWMRLEALPLSTNGKLDRRRLPAPVTGGEDDEAVFQPPRNATEQAVVELWREVLGAEYIGVHDGFFSLGGHSLSAIRLLSRVRRTLGAEVTPPELWEHSTPARFAALVRERWNEGEMRSPPLVPVDRSKPLPLSCSQQQLWLLHQLDPGCTAYHLAGAFDLEGDLSGEFLHHATARVVARHEALRTRFAASGGVPLQSVLPPAPPLDPRIDLDRLDPDGADREAERVSTSLARRTFDLERDSLFRLATLRRGSRRHRLVVVLHHIVADGWSLEILAEELSVLYSARREGRPVRLPPLPIQYGDYAVWERNRLSEGRLDAQLAWWRERLSDLPPPQRVADRRGSSGHGVEGRVDSRLGEDLVERVRGVARREGLTVFLVLLAAFETLLHRHGAGLEFAVGTPSAGRSQPEIEGVVGLFANTLVMRADLGADPTGGELLRRVRGEALEALRHQEVPFDRLVEELQPLREGTRTPLLEAVLVLQNDPPRPPALSGLKVTRRRLPPGDAKFDLTLAFAERSDGLDGTLHYDRSRYDHTTARRLLDHFLRLLEGMTADLGVPVSKLAVLSPGEHHQVLREWTTIREAAVEDTLHARFTSIAADRPDAPAVRWEGGVVSYGELSRRAARLAAALVELGVGPEVRVGVCLRRSPELITALLGVLEAGGCYVPLDPEYPDQRLELLLTDSYAALVVTSRDLVQRFSGHDVPWLAVDEVRTPGRPEVPLPGGAAEHAAYVIYTSGSTGRPKGVVVEHRQVLRLFESTRSWLRAAPDDTWALFHSYAFDFSVWEIWGALLHGGRLVVVPEDRARSPEAFAELLQAEAVTILNQTPSAFRQLTASLASAGRPAALRLVVFGGEALNVEILKPWWMGADSEGPEIVNMYGITETTVHVTRRVMTRADLGAPGTSPLGRALPDLSVHLLDRDRRPVAIGVPGEIFVGGAGVARGYLGRPRLTAERFVPDPFAPRPGLRLYRSGDLARRWFDGELEFFGRSDWQVKLRGFRVEPAEVAAALAAHPSVDDAVVVPRESAEGLELVAYYVGAPGPPAAELRGWARGRLPAHMVPAAFVAVDAFPLTAHGKLDHRALPEPDRASRGAEADFAEPRSLTERRLAELWAGVLGLDRVGVDDNFFQLGGHSLLATRLVAEIRAAFGTDLGLRVLFENPTVAGLAVHLDTWSAEGPPTADGPVPLMGEDEALLSYPQQRIWFDGLLDVSGSAYNLIQALRLEGRLELVALHQAMRDLVERHAVLRTVFTGRDGEPVQRVLPSATPGLAYVDLDRLAPARQEAEARRLLAELVERPFELGLRPPMRGAVLRLQERRHLLALALHHLVCDAWSQAVLMRDLSALYRAALAGRPADLPELRYRYVDFARWQRARLTDEALAGLLTSWRRRLADLPGAELPTDRPRPAEPRRRSAARHPVVVPAEATRALRAVASSCDATLFMALAAALQVVLHKHTGSNDLVIGTNVAGRTVGGSDELVGCFINMLLLRNRVEGDLTYRQLLDRVSEVTTDALDHQDLPYDLLVRELRSLGRGRGPLFQVKLELRNVPAAPVHLPGLTVEPVEPLRTIVRQDLALSLEEEDDHHLRGWLLYDTDLFEAGTAALLTQELVHALERAGSAPETTVSELVDHVAQVRRDSLAERRRRRKDENLARLKSGRRTGVPAIPTDP